MSELMAVGELSIGNVHSISKYVSKRRDGKIKITSKNKSSLAIKLLICGLLAITVYAFLSFDYKNIDIAKAVSDTFHNIGVVFFQPELKRETFIGILYQLLVTFCLGALSTVFGAALAFFCSLLCAKNIANPAVANVIKSFIALVRAVPTVLWVLIFAVSAGLGSVAAVVGLTFHSFAYLTKVYAESIEEMDMGTIEALKASGAGFELHPKS